MCRILNQSLDLHQNLLLNAKNEDFDFASLETKPLSACNF